MEKLLIGLFIVACKNFLSYTARDHLHHTSGLGTPTSIVNHKNTPTDLPTDLYDGSVFSAKVPSSQMMPVDVKIKIFKNKRKP